MESAISKANANRLSLSIHRNRRVNGFGKHKLIVCSVSIFVCVLLAQGQTSERRDGTWWLGQSRNDKLNYFVGFLDGMDLGSNFSYWGIMDKNSKDSCTAEAVQSYSGYTSKYFTNVTNGQLVDGLDDFYKDYRNRTILISNATWLVLQGIAGTPQDQLNKMIENWRRNASTP